MAAAPAAAAVWADVLWCLGLGCLVWAVRDGAELLLGRGPVRCFVLDLLAFTAGAVLLVGFSAGVSAAGLARWYMAAGLAAGALAWQKRWCRRCITWRQPPPGCCWPRPVGASAISLHLCAAPCTPGWQCGKRAGTAALRGKKRENPKKLEKTSCKRSRRYYIISPYVSYRMESCGKGAV